MKNSVKKALHIMICLCVMCAATSGTQGGGKVKAYDIPNGIEAGPNGIESTDTEWSMPKEWLVYDEEVDGIGWVVTDSGVISVTGQKSRVLCRGEENGLKWVITDFGHLSVTGHMEDPSLYKSLSFRDKEVPWSRNVEPEYISTAYLGFTGAKSLRGLFDGCSNLENVYLTDLDTGNVTDMSGMFKNCESLKKPDLGSLDTRNVTDMSYMFYNCMDLISLDLGNFDTRNVTNMNSMFAMPSAGIFNRSDLTSLDLGSFDTRNVTDMSGMFSACGNLEEILVGDGWRETEGETAKMFEGCATDHVTRK